MKEHQHRGLTSAQVEESRRLHGDNLITPRKGDSAWKLFAEKFRDPIIQVLLVAALLSLAMAFIDGEFLETIGIICAIVLAKRSPRFRSTADSPVPIATAPAAMAAVRSAPAQAAGNLPETGLNRC